MPIRDISPPARMVIVGAAVVIVLAGIKVATPILGPFLVAVFFAMITAPAMAWLRHRGVPPAIAAGTVVAGLIGILVAAALFLWAAFTQFLRSLPRYLAALEEQTAGYGISSENFQIWDFIDQGTVIQQAAGIARDVGNIALDAFLVAIAIAFLLLEAPRLAAGLKKHFGAENTLYKHFSQSGRILIIT